MRQCVPVFPSVLLALVALAVPSPAIAQSTMLVFQSEPGDYIGQGQSVIYTPDVTQEFTVQKNGRGGVSANVIGPGYDFWWSLDFAAREGTPLTPGYYPGAQRYPFTSMTAMRVGGSGRGCNTLTGRFLVREVVFGGNGEVLKAAIDAEQHCEDSTPALFVALRYNSTVPPDIFPDSIGQYAIRITPSQHGVVTGDGISCGGGIDGCIVIFDGATTATLTALPDPGYIFTGWTGACSGGATTAVNVNTIRDCEATFDTAIPTTPRTLLYMKGESSGAIGGAGERLFSLRNSLWGTSAWSDGTVNISVNGAGPKYDANWTVRIKPPGNLQLGQWTEVMRFGDGVRGGLDVSGEGSGCNTVYGRYRIHEWRRDPTSGALTALAVDFEQRCQPTAPLLTGTLHYRATFEIPITCTTPDPFAGLGGGTCHNGGWLPPGMTPPAPPSTEPPPTEPPPTTPPTTSACSTPDPFAAIGGGTCYNGGWLPPGMPVPGGSNPLPPSEPLTPMPPPPSSGTCSTPDPFAAIGGGTCYSGGWLPPGMPVPNGPTTPPPMEPSTPPSSPGTCTTPDPFASLGGGTCFRGGWLPPGMPIPGGG